MICQVGPRINNCPFHILLLTIYSIFLCVSCSSSSLSNIFWNLPHKLESEITETRIKRANLGDARTTLIHNMKCRGDLNRLCTSLNINSDDLSVLECIETAKGEAIATISKDCHHELWTATNLLTDNSYLRSLVISMCSSDWKTEWDHHENLLMKLLDSVNNIKSPQCRLLVQRIGLVAFSDFRIIAHFTNACESAIQRFQCGRIGLDKMMLSQGLTLMCLQQHLEDENFDKMCKEQVLHFSSVQAENIKFDRQLYLACNVELNKFCPTITIGLGQAYECLMKHKFDPLISQQCQDQLVRHQKLIVQDYSVSKGLARACKEDIRNYRCRRLVSEDKGVRLAQILLCLENAIKNGSKVSWDCHKEMAEHRRMLLEDYRLSPEIVSHCSNDILDYCNGLEAGGRTIHCLMEHSRPKRRKDRVSPPCQRALEDLVEKTDPGEDWRVDPFLKDACKPVVDKACQDMIGGDARVMNCLMEKLGTDVMTENCEEALLQIQYFVARDFKLDTQLYRACHGEAVKLCHAKKAWHDEETMNPDTGPLVLPCLFRYIYNNHHAKDKLSLKCSDEVRRVMRQRALSVELQPQIEYSCLNDLARYCLNEQEPSKGEEMLCLQDHLESLDPECKKVILNFTEVQSENLELHPLITTHCKVIISHYCEMEPYIPKKGGYRHLAAFNTWYRKLSDDDQRKEAVKSNPRGAWLVRREERRRKAKEEDERRRKEYTSVSVAAKLLRESGNNGPILGRNPALAQFHKVLNTQVARKRLDVRPAQIKSKYEPPVKVSLDEYRVRRALDEMKTIPTPLSPIPEEKQEVLVIQMAEEDYVIEI